MSAKPDDASSYATSPSLLLRLQVDDAEAWARLVDLYGPLIFSWGRRGGLSKEDAADVMQEVFSSVAKAVRRFDPAAQGRFRGWLWTITRNKINDHHRRAAGQIEPRGGDTAYQRLAELPEQWQDDQSQVTRHEVSALYHRAMSLIQADFQPQTWQAFWLTVVDERPTADVAEQLGISANGVRQARSRVLRRLRAELGDGGASGE